MRHNHTRDYRAAKRMEGRYGIEYFHDPSRPRLRQIIDDDQKTIFINAAADWDADEVERVGGDSMEEAR